MNEDVRMNGDRWEEDSRASVEDVKVCCEKCFQPDLRPARSRHLIGRQI